MSKGGDEEKKSGHGLVHNFFFIITSIISILSFLMIVIPDYITKELIGYAFIVSIAAFFILLSVLFCVFLFRLEPDLKDGRYWLILIPAVLSLVSFVLYFKNGNQENNWGLYTLITGFFVFLLIIILVFASWGSRSFVASDSKDFTINTVTTTLTRLKEHEFEYDIYKNIQAGKPLLTKMEIKFKWSGDVIDPSKVIPSSVTHEVTPIKVEDQEYDHVTLSFKTPLFYKQATTCHLHLDNLTDFEKQSKPYLAFSVKEDEPVRLIRYRVYLKDVDRHYDRVARLERRKESSPNGVVFVPVKGKERIEFDPETKSYHVDLVDPEPGYDYRVNWGESS
jgi:hypothetical protein